MIPGWEVLPFPKHIFERSRQDGSIMEIRRDSNIIAAFLSLASLCTSAQTQVAPTEEFSIRGAVLQSKTYRLADLEALPAQSIPDMVISNHKGDALHTLRGLKGIPVKRLLDSIRLDHSTPRDLNTFAFICRASDGYAVLFSWNELYNTPVGDGVFILTQSDGRGIREMGNRILLVSQADRMTGRRHVKGLSSIEVTRLR